jgi:hypothetical protein
MTPLQKVRKRWPKAEWIDGKGHYASVAHCRGTTVHLFEARAEAEQAKHFIDSFGCGGGCHKRHEIVDMH